MRPWHFGVASLLFGLAGVSLGAPKKPPAEPQISVRVNVVSVPVTVTNSHGDFVGNLRQADFRLLVDESERPIEYFTPEEDPAELLILLETSPAVYLLRGEHLAAAADLLAGLSADDRVGVASYGDEPELLLNFTTDKRQALAALLSANYGIGMANLNFYAGLAAALDWAGSGDRKRAIVALTTGLDSSGAGSWEALLQKMRASNVMVVPVGLGGTLRETPTPKGSRRNDGFPGGQELSFAESSRALEAIAAETGGRAFFPRNAKDFQIAYRRIAALLRHQYSLGFTVPVSDGRYHTIRVELAGKERGRSYRIGARRGYLAQEQ